MSKRTQNLMTYLTALWNIMAQKLFWLFFTPKNINSHQPTEHGCARLSVNHRYEVL